ncbi:homoserine dehydrogenase [Alkaliphilus peptidifermentans]|uniref:Homoserine dehydrogenase n=1 Tax=Alkaliphilus peptidifermentans DSM 18978 TaxID=1120976 RepID=A0A1G5JYB8_9FIRM|nr:homoserine dehydrogenase [Alkaliphilus peptidifermentans]SCY93393.1 homoserine dehydrogenase [Alkaliphilus peptidifermentans DSM 18978]
MNKVKIGLMGLGNIGRGVWKIFEFNKLDIEKSTGYSFEISKVLVKDLKKQRELDIPVHLLTTDPLDILNDKDIEIVVELIGGIEPAKDYILKAIRNKKHVVTANKAVIASHGNELIEAAIQEKVYLQFEGSVAGGIPILDSIKDSLTANKIDEIMGIVNGTTNYILSKMTNESTDFFSALKEAQGKGYAEADPTSDVEGYDASYKLSILSSLAFGTQLPVSAIYREGITKITPIDIEYARELGYVIKLLAIGKQKKDCVELRVHPTLIPVSHPLATIQDAFNGIFIRGNAVGDLMYYGKGAGDLPTGSAVVGNIISIIKKKQCSYIPDFKVNNAIEIQSMDSTICEYYVRIMVKDIPGVLGRIATEFGKGNVSLSSVIQKGEGEPQVSLVFVTHLTNELNVQNSLMEILKINEVIEIANVIRVEK